MVYTMTLEDSESKSVSSILSKMSEKASHEVSRSPNRCEGYALLVTPKGNLYCEVWVERAYFSRAYKKVKWFSCADFSSPKEYLTYNEAERFLTQALA